MNCHVLQESLLQCLHDVQRSVPSRPSLPILACVLLEARENGQLSLSATDLQIGTISQSAAEVESPGKVAVPAKVFIDFVATLSPGKLTLSLEKHTLTVSGGGATAKIQCFAADDYPTFPEPQGDQMTFPTEIFQQAVQNTAFAASADDARPILTALLFKGGAQFEVVATDGFRLATMALAHAFPDSTLLIPARALQEVLRVVGRKKTAQVTCQVSQKLRQVFFRFEDVAMLVRLMDGEFPPYQKIIPESFVTQITFSGEEFAQKLKTAMIFAREAAGIVKLQLKGEELQITSTSASSGNQVSSLPVKVLAGSDQEIAFNIKYLNDFLSVMKPEVVWLGVNDSLKPALFRPENLPDFKYVVMPFRAG